MTTAAPPSPSTAHPRRRLLLLGALAAGAGVSYYLTSQPDPSHPYKSSFSSGLGLAKAYSHLSPYLLPHVDPERGHRLAVTALALPPTTRHLLGLTSPPHLDPPSLSQTLLHSSFPNPLGLAAGFDKGGECIDGVLDLGFGWVEVGSVTPEPQVGNDLPRVFRLQEDRAVINRYGFNSEGVEQVKERLQQWVEGERRKGGDSTPRVLGVNLGKNKTSPSALDDYTRGLRALGPYASYVVINVSSPNTPNLRDLQHRAQLTDLLASLCAERDRLTPTLGHPLPLLLKIAPDLSPHDRHDIAHTALQLPIDGLIISNTTLARPDGLQSADRGEVGGLSGRPLRAMATELIRDMYVRTGGKVVIVGVGGVESGSDVVEKMKAGASLVQMYSAFSYDGPCVVSRIKQELLDCMRQEGVTHVSQLIGKDVSREELEKGRERSVEAEAQAAALTAWDRGKSSLAVQ